MSVRLSEYRKSTIFNINGLLMATEETMRWLAAVFVISLLLSGQPAAEPASGALVPHAPFRIDSDAEFSLSAASEGWPGSGTAADPYVIRGYDINGTSSAVPWGIYIGNTTVHFQIRDCSVHGVQASDGDSRFFGSGI